MWDIYCISCKPPTMFLVFLVIIFSVDKKSRNSGWWDTGVDHSHTPDLLNLHLNTFIFFRIYQTANLVQILSFLLPPSKTRWQKWHFCCQLKPSSLSLLSLSQYNGLLPSPHPLQLLALPSFSPSGYLRQRQAAADRTVQAREQLGKRGRDSWTCRQLHLLWPGTTRTHKTSLMGWSQYYSTTYSRPTCGLSSAHFQEEENKKVFYLFTSIGKSYT